MQLLYLQFGLLLIIGLCQVLASGFDCDFLRQQGDELKTKLLAFNFHSDDIKSLKRYIEKIVEKVEEKNRFSKTSISIGDLKESIKKYSEKLLKLIEKSEYIDSIYQVQASQNVHEFLSLIEKFSFSDKTVSVKDDYFIEKLRQLPPESIGGLYAGFWDTINSIEPDENSKALLLDSAMDNFCSQFSDAINRDLSAFIMDPSISPCMYNAYIDTFKKVSNKVGTLLVPGRGGDEEEKH